MKFDLYFSTVYNFQYKKTISAKSANDAETEAKKILETLTVSEIKSWELGEDEPCFSGIKFDWINENDED